MLPRDVAGAVARLPEIELLLEAKQVEIRTHPAARCPLHLEGLRGLDVELVRLRVERREPARAALRQHDPDDLARPRIVVVVAGVEDQFLHRRRHAFRAAVPHVEQRGAAPDRARVRTRLHPRVIEPVVEVREQRHRFVVAGDAEEVPVLERHETADVLTQRRFQVGLDLQDVLVFQPRHVFRHGAAGALLILLG